MKKYNSKSVSGLVASASVIAMLATAPAYAQEPVEAGVATDEPADETTPVVTIGADGETTDGDAIVVTGSRIRQTTYSSISPLQILTTEAAQNVGEFDAAQILQRSEAAAGTQIDATFQGFVLNNGPGSQTLDLRGLGADRTLLMVNGRRLAPAGVEGAPTNPSINLIPSSLVQRYDLLLDGASSVYGSDAIAGVGNIILRRDIEGPELFVSGNINPNGGGDDYTISGAWGKTFRNGMFGIGVEYSRRDEVLLGDRDFLSGCDTHYEVDQNGNIHTLDVATNALALQETYGEVTDGIGPCKLDRITGRIQLATRYLGSIYYDTKDYGLGVPGNSYVPNYSESYSPYGFVTDVDGDGVADVNLFERTANGYQQDQTFISPQDLYNVMAYGEYTFDGDMNITPFFEANYSRAEVSVLNSGTPQFFPWVPSTNAFNPCNFTVNPNGVDCGLAENRFLGGAFNSTGRNLPTRPIPSVRGDRNNVETVQEMYRGVLGLRGDLPFIDDSWSFEVSGTYSRSEGSSVRLGIREDKLALALGIDPTADFNNDGIVDNNGDGIADDYISQTTSPLLAGGACDISSLANPELAMPDLADGCVPVNLFASSLYLPGPIGDFETAAERDYLFGVRSFDTVYEQLVLSGFLTGDVIELPAGPVGIVLGGEYRRDRINSQPDAVASNGLFWGYFADQGAQGSKYLLEAFGEINVPVWSSDFWGDFEVNASGRITDEEYYGTAETYSLKAGWLIADAVLLKGSYGTSFRAPNLRENFLAGQSGFGSIVDPCAVPEEAYDGIGGGGYDATRDTREATTIQNCIREGRDPTTVGVGAGSGVPTQIASAEITSGGSLALDPETSRSITLGVGITETYGTANLSLNINYYDIKVKGAIIEPSGQFIVNECFIDDDGVRSRFCDFINYNTDPASTRLISDVFAGFVNVNQETVKGLDFNASLSNDFLVGGEHLTLGINLRANRLLERNTLSLSDNGEPDLEEYAGEFGYPSWTGRATFTAEYKNLLFTWQTRYIGSVSQAASEVDPLSDAWGYNAAGEYTGFFSDTCLGAGSRDSAGNLDGIVAGDGLYCSDVGYAGDYFIHTVSLRYEMNDMITLRAGVTNLFDKAPPLIDTNEVFGISNTAIGNGYDLDGREFFGSVSVRF